ncbi:MAG: glycosyltransferase family 2 protein [Lachnospiraceae bacterium]|nr:glycosyltransferase family 2 protein [Lachnospiraceae bacterium]
MKLSVAMCTHNGAEYIRDQLDSILSQALPISEIVICDDDSEDDTLGIIEEYKTDYQDTDWKIYRNRPALGVTSNFEKAISLCTGDIIFTSDQDDVWYEKKVSRMIQAFEENPKAVLVFCNADVTEADTTMIRGEFWKTIPFDETQRNKFLTGDVYDVLRRHNVVTGAMMAMKRDFALQCMPFPKGGMLHDDWLALCAPVYGGIVPVDERLIAYRQHGNNEVGAGLYQHAVRWLKNARKRKPWAHAVERSMCFYETYRERLTEEDNKQFFSWYQFNLKRDRMSDSGLFASLGFLFLNLINGEYRKNVCPFLATWVQDFIYIFLTKTGRDE